MINKEIANNVIAKALSTGGDFAEIFIENTIASDISVVNGKVDKAISGNNFGVGIRIFNGSNAVYAYTNSITEKSLMYIASQGAEAFNKGPQQISKLDFTCDVIKNAHIIMLDPQKIAKLEVVDLLKKICGASTAHSKEIQTTSGLYMSKVKEICIINSNGLWAEDKRTYTLMRNSCVASNGIEQQVATNVLGAHQGYELLTIEDPLQIGKTIASRALTSLYASYAPRGQMPVVIENGFGGVIFHEACGHSLEATSVAIGASEFCSKLGQQIASAKVTAIDDGTIQNAWGSTNIDDEGIATRKNVLIENGVLKSYMVDTLNGRRMGAKSTGSARRESYKFAPTSRMTNTYIAEGTDDDDEIIKSTEYGLYAKKMGGGSVDPATGEFNFAVAEAYIIKDGEIKEPVRGASLIGKGSTVLMDIDKVGKTLAHAPGMCGSISGSVPTNVGQPRIRVKKITVGGRS